MAVVCPNNVSNSTPKVAADAEALFRDCDKSFVVIEYELSHSVTFT